MYFTYCILLTLPMTYKKEINRKQRVSISNSNIMITLCFYSFLSCWIQSLIAPSESQSNKSEVSSVCRVTKINPTTVSLPSCSSAQSTRSCWSYATHGIKPSPSSSAKSVIRLPISVQWDGAGCSKQF